MFVINSYASFTKKAYGLNPYKLLWNYLIFFFKENWNISKKKIIFFSMELNDSGSQDFRHTRTSYQ